MNIRQGIGRLMKKDSQRKRLRKKGGVPYKYGSEMRTYLPDFIVLVDDGWEDPLNLIAEIKGYRREDAKEKNHHGNLLDPWDQ